MARPSISHRDLRNAPGKVFERLASGEALTLVSVGTGKAVLIPVEDGDVEVAVAARACTALSSAARSPACRTVHCRAG